MSYHFNNSDPGQLEKNLKITFASPSKNALEKKEEKKIMSLAKFFTLHANAIMTFYAFTIDTASSHFPTLLAFSLRSLIFVYFAIH